MNTSEQYKRLALGTVQFGLPYGVSNQQGQVSEAEVQSILDLAKANGVLTLDTAIAYGESEKVLGKSTITEFEIVTKLPAIPNECQDIYGWVNMELEGSLARLNVSKVDSLLLHQPNQLLSNIGGQLYEALQKKKQEGLVKYIGVSIYSPDELDQLTEKFQLDLIQAPFNIIDNRLNEDDWFKKLALSGTRLHVRSIFMQGLLLMPTASRPKKFNRWASLWSLWDEWLEESELTPLQACLRYALSIPEIEKVVVGVDSSKQLKEILQAAKGDFPAPPSGLSSVDINLLNPSLWNQL